MITAQTISEYGLFNGLNAGELESLIAVMSEVRFEPNTLILQESTLSSDLFLLKSGRVSIEIDISSYNTGGREQIVILRPGDIFGEVAFLENKRRSAHVVSLDSVTAIKIDGVQLRQLFTVNHKIGYIIMKNIAITLSQRLIDTNFKWRNTI